jgi:gliding motility-associated-like protein
MILFINAPVFTQEICDNGIDDDFDGLIDLNDSDCFCELLIPNSLIPNPSFEDQNCCPAENARLDCAVDWLQASAPTTDYVHTCENYLGNTSIPAFAPLPFPDGEGGVGFRDGQTHVGPNYKEYVGACLTEPMEVGKHYRLDFYVGFRDNVPGSKDFNIAIFAAKHCFLLPFGGDEITVGCPANTGYYNLIGEKHVSGSNEWINVVFEFYADQPYEVLILGPGCASNPNYTLDPYFYLDRLAFAESSRFGEPFDKVEGSICTNDLFLSVSFNPDYHYQWYCDGVALPGETGPSISLLPEQHEEGQYQVRITTANGCFLSTTYDLRIPPYTILMNESICSNETYAFGDQLLDTTGYYERTIPAIDGCDSIIQLNLDVLPVSSHSFADTICEGEVFEYLDISTSEGGMFQTVLTNNIGCDSLISVVLTKIPKGKNLLLPEDQIIDLGQSIQIEPSYIDPLYTNFYWTNENNELITYSPVLDHLPVNSTLLYFNALDQFGCPVKDSIQIRIRKDYDLYIPNAFTPNGDHLNDLFNFIVPASVDHVVGWSIFDRWGNKVFHEDYPDTTGIQWGWDGTYNGKHASIGVYIYIIKAKFIDGAEKTLAGDITLIR